MKTSIFILTIFVTFSCGQHDQNVQTKEIVEFDKFLGDEKSKSLDELVNSFDSFINTNYSDKNNQSDRIREFLLHILDTKTTDSLWVFDTDKNLEVVENLESSGLRREIWIHSYERYEPRYDIGKLMPVRELDTSNHPVQLSDHLVEVEEIPTIESKEDSTEIARRENDLIEKHKKLLSYNTSGQFLYALAKYSPNDTYIQEYVKLKIEIGGISMEIFTSYLLENIDNLDDPFIKRIIVTEIYYNFINWDILRNSK